MRRPSLEEHLAPVQLVDVARRRDFLPYLHGVRARQTAVMRVWIDQDLCTGDEQCVEICPDVFFGYDSGTSYRCFVRAPGEVGLGPDGTPTLRMNRGVAPVPPALEAAVVEAAEYCPGSCIFVEPE
jgi:ferredoxin